MDVNQPEAGRHEQPNRPPLTLEGLLEDPIGTVLVGTFRGVERVVRKGLKHPLTVVPAAVLGGVGLVTALALLRILPDEEEQAA